MYNPVYKIKVGSVDIDSSQPGTMGRVLGISTFASMTPAAGAVTIILAQGNGQNVQKDDPVSIELGYGGQTVPVMKGTVQNIKPGFDILKIIAYTPVQKLLDLRLNQTYENQSAGDIVSDLAGQVNMDTQTVEKGIPFPFYVIDDRKNGWEHLYDIAQKCGFDLYLTPDSKLMFKEFKKSSAAFTLTYGKTIISLRHSDVPQDFNSVTVRGESPASSQGTNTSHWLTKSFDNFKGSTGTEKPVRSIQDAVIRTKEAADASAKGRMNFIQRKRQQGTVDIIGNANIKLGDIFEIKQAPQNDLNGLFQVRAVSHTLNKQTGFKTRIHFWGSG
jgi:phage protein D